MALYGLKSLTTEKKTYWVIGPACIGSVTSSSVVVVAPLKPERIRPTGLAFPRKASYD